MFGKDSNGAYGSLDRPGIEGIGQQIQVEGENFGTSAMLEYCTTPRIPCTGSRVDCCEGLWESSNAFQLVRCIRN